MTKERTKELKHNRTLLHKDSSQEEKNSHKRVCKSLHIINCEFYLLALIKIVINYINAFYN